jgi:predicted RNA-binding protein YlxR (DUF448 family)
MSQPLNKHVPQRMCAVCRTREAKRAMTRVVRLAAGGIELDPSGKRSGRGAYLCDDPACWEKAATTGILEKALRTSLDAEARARLRSAMPAQ